MGEKPVSIGFTDLLERVASAGIPSDAGRLRAAFDVAADIYGSQMHWTGVSILEHTHGVLRTLLPFEPDEDAIIACLLHHVLQTRRCTVSDLEEQFGPSVRALVSGVHLLSHVTLRGRRMSIEDLRLMLLTVSDDVRTVLITLCDRSFLLARLDALLPEERRRICNDVLQLFAPVAARLGIYALKHHLEARAFPVVYPADAEHIEEQLQRVHAERGDFLPEAARKLEGFLREQGIAAAVEAREKEPYSIFSKMRRKSLSSIEDVNDLFALRVLVATEEECYRALGLLHRLGRPIPNRFKDYIAFPKPNGYQSLHTTIAQLPGTPPDTFVEVQVRTHAMHREAQYGVAAHWSYKEHGSAARAVHLMHLQSMLASQQLLEEGAGGETSLADHIFVLTPKGDVVELPEGATPLDFAFQVHTDLGLSFRAARVNGAIAPLNYRLENGDVVEILRYRTPRPSAQWMQLLSMASSRSKLKHYLHAQERPQLIARGRELPNEELHEQSAPLPKAPSLPEHPPTGEPLLEFEDGLPMPARFAQCCKPQESPRGPIQGLINRTGAVMVHRRACRMLRAMNPERGVRVRWR